MEGPIPTWPIELENRPAIRQAGVGRHAGPATNRYQMLGFWCLHVYPYRADLRVNNQWYEIHPGCVSILPPDADLEYRISADVEHAYVHFLIPAGHPEASPRLPVMQQLGERYAAFDRAVRQAIAWQTISPARAEVRLWDLLWQLTDSPASAPHDRHGTHPAVERAMRRIELRLGQPISASALAEELEISHNHLIRLFRAATGCSILEYVRHRRVERAEHLLRFSTLPIKVIARQVGLADLHLFNKTIRRELKGSPREVRARRKESE